MSESKDAISPVIGVILVVAITVGLSAVVGVVVFDIGNSMDSSVGSGDKVAVTTTTNPDGTVSIRVITGKADELRVLVNGSEASSLSNVSAGDSIDVVANSTADITIISVTNGKSEVVSRTSGAGGTQVSSPTSLPTPRTSNLIIHYTFDEPSGTLRAVDSANNHDGSLSGSITPGIAGVSNSAYDFSGGKISIPNGFHTFSNNITVSVWTNLDSVTPASDSNIVYIGNDGETALVHTGTGNVRAQVKTTTGNWYTASVPAQTGWTHFTYTYDGDTLRLYVDGSLVAENTDATGSLHQPSGSYPPSVGGADTDAISTRIDGQLDVVRIYDATLSDSEISDIYVAESGAASGPASTLVAHYKFDGTSGGVVDSANGYDGAISGTVNRGVSGINGSAFDFAGGYVTLDQYYYFEQNFTISAWVNPDAGTYVGYFGSMGEFGMGEDTGQWRGSFKSSSTNSWFKVVGGTVTTGSWTHLVTTYDGDTLRLYVNGTLVASNTSATGPLYHPSYSNYPPSLGGAETASGSNRMDGQLDSIRLYDSVLSEPEIDAIYEDESGRVAP